MGKSTIQTAKGVMLADLVLKNGNVLNVFTEEIYTADVAITSNVIAGVGSYKGEREIDCTGKYIVPGFIDAHVHIESSMVTPLEFAKHIIRSGTTGIVADPHEIVNVSGKKGLDFILDASENIPVNTYIMIPSSVPATDIDTNGAGKFLAKDMLPYKANPRVLGLGEMMRFVDVLNEQKETIDKLEAFSDMIIDGHAPGITGKDVQAYRAAGVIDDHECATAEEGLEKLRAGFWILVREGSGARNLESLMKGFMEAGISLEQCMFCTDDKHLEDIEKEGHINACIRKAIAMGVPAIKAYKMASFNAARAYQIKNAGAIGPGQQADIVIVGDLSRAEPSFVIKSGKIVDEEWLGSFHYELKDESLLQTVNVGSLSLKDLDFAQKEVNHVIELVPNQLLTLHKEERIPGDNGKFIPDSEYAKLVVAERHGRSGKVGVCPIKGYGIKNGAVATTVSHDSHNMIAVGDNDDDILCAIKELKKIQGGYVIASGNRIVDELPLTIGGLMSMDKAVHVQERTSKMVQTARNMGVREGIDPFITLSFMALTVIPELRLTEAGIFDVTNMKFLT
ncbi:MAG: adenine deaminase [Ruminococcus sp.]|nr:adenine deaminase [Ruminococcus sp.]